ncbi:MAG TPA: SDR family oxidoreductase [Candidatus Manganitrophaceae bacterium]|nr:SDR family oxidoreductase [Candidatus Manganitrophaceae bacterium]
MNGQFLEGWALILGASSGFGEACALELAGAGMDIFGVHLDRKGTLPNVDRIAAKIKEFGRQAAFYNVNAADPEKRKAVLEEIQKVLRGGSQGGTLHVKEGSVRVLVHSLAFGTLKPFIAPSHNEAIAQPQMEMTLDVMANSLVYWTQDLLRAGLLGRGGRIYAMTSAGGARVWKSYGAVSAAKSALESHVRQLALELGPSGICVNAVRAGVTDTPALRKIPGHEEMIQMAKARNPMGRLTTPEDVAGAIALLSHPKAQWITGNVIGVDGGEFIVD